MGLIGDLLGVIGGKTKPRTIAMVEAALGRLADERTAAREGVARAMRDRDALLLIDETDKKITELDAVADRHRLTLERCDKAEPLLLRELEQLRSEAKQARWRALRERYDAAAQDYARSLRIAVEKMTVLMNLSDEAGREGFGSETRAAFIVPVRMISAEAVDKFEFEIERAREMGKPAPPPAPVAPPSKVVIVAPKPKPAPPPVASKPAPPPKPPFVPQPDEDGNVKIVVVRPGLSLEGRAQARAGEIVALPMAQATAIVRSGHADYEGAL